MDGTDGDPGGRGRWRRWLDALLLLGTLILVALFARHVDWALTRHALRRANVVLVALAVAVDLASLVVRGLRWALLLRAVGARGTMPAIRDAIVGAALNNVVVANGGDAARVAISARRSHVSSADVFATLAVERFCDVAVYVALCGALALGVALPGPFARWSAIAVGAAVVITLLCVILVARRGQAVFLPAAIRDPRSADDQASSTRRHPLKAATRGALRYARRLAAAIATLAAGRRLAIALVLSLIVWVGQWVTFHVTARAAALPISGVASLLALLVVNASFVIRVTPGNVGLFQLLYVLAATAAGLDKGRALAVGLLIQAVQYIPVTFLGLILAPAFARDTWRRTQPSVAASDGASTPAP